MKPTRPRGPRLQKVEPIMQDKEELKSITFDYKDPANLRRFMTESGNIVNRERSGLNAKQQRRLTKQIKRARQIALLPFVATL